jgi:SWI/SNF-related matrix-associated actin-dependent regulator of chromatin subfamily A protein 2/4
MPRSSTFLPKVTNNNDNGNRSHNNSGRSVNSTWSVALASIPSDQSHYSIHDIDGSDYFTHYSENNQSNKNSEDDNQSGSQSVDSEHSDENDHAMVHNLSMNSNGGGHYVQVHRIPSNAPARRPRSRSRSTNGSGSGSNNNSERSGLDNSTKSKENALDVVANALSVAAAAVGGDDNDNEQSHHHRLHYERIDSRNHSEIESDNVQLSGEHEPQKSSGSIK